MVNMIKEEITCNNEKCRCKTKKKSDPIITEKSRISNWDYNRIMQTVSGEILESRPLIEQELDDESV